MFRTLDTSDKTSKHRIFFNIFSKARSQFLKNQSREVRYNYASGTLQNSHYLKICSLILAWTNTPHILASKFTFTLSYTDREFLIKSI